MKQLLPTLFLFSTLSLFAQDPELAPCGSIEGRSEWLQHFQKHELHQYSQKRTDLTIALSVHLLGDAPGREFSLLRTLQTLGALERDYEDTGIEFRVDLNFDTIYSAAYDNHPDVLTGADMMFEHNDDNALNLYFVRNPAGNCGYNLPYAGIAVANQCSGAASKTLAHEVGHGLSLPHPFLGWEGGQTINGEVPADFGQPAPLKVTYDYTYFQQTLVRDTTIIDTTEVEFVDRRNCTNSADGFCDTQSDYIANRWTCSNDGLSPAAQLDPAGESFRSDGTLIMSYANDVCQTRFSDDQITAMQAFAQQERSSWIRTTGDTSKIYENVKPDYVDGEVLPSPLEIPFLEASQATHYYVQVSERRSFRDFLVDTVVTSLTIPLNPSDFVAGETYYWRAYPYSDHSFRQGVSSSFTFVYPQSSGTREIALEQVNAFPNPALASDVLNLGAAWENAQATVTTSTGQQVAITQLDAAGNLSLPAINVAAGLYTVSLTSQDGLRRGASRFLVR